MVPTLKFIQRHTVQVLRMDGWMVGRQFFVGNKRILPRVTQGSRDKTELRGKEVAPSRQSQPLRKVELCPRPQAGSACSFPELFQEWLRLRTRFASSLFWLLSRGETGFEKFCVCRILSRVLGGARVVENGHGSRVTGLEGRPDKEPTGYSHFFMSLPVSEVSFHEKKIKHVNCNTLTIV